MASPLFTIRLVVNDERHEIGYESVTELLLDSNLEALFDLGHVSECSIRSGDQRIAGLPRMEWRYLRDAVVSNSTAILRRLDA